MDHLEIAIGVTTASSREIWNQRMEQLKTARLHRGEDTSSKQGLLHEELFGDKKIMMVELCKAVENNGDVDRFLDVLEAVSGQKELPVSAIFDQVNQAGDSLLHVAAFFGRERIAELVSEHFPELVIRGNIRGDTALHVAARSKKTGVIKVILSQYAKEKKDLKITRLTNEYGNTALHEAVLSKHLDGVIALLDEDRPVVHYLNKSGRSPLYLAVLTKDPEILTPLLETPFPINDPLPRCHGNSPLHATILERNPGLLKEILERRPELIYLRDEDGMTPLHYAAYIGYVEGVRILLKKSSVTALERDTKGHLPIHLACKKGRLMVVKELLKQEWPHPRVLLNHKGQNILHVAAKNGKILVVRYLLRNKKITWFTINEKDKNGNTPLHLASRNLFLRVMYVLAHDKRIDVSLINNEGLTARDVVWLHTKDPRTLTEFVAHMVLKRCGVPLKLIDMLRPQRQPLPNKDWNVKEAANTLLLVAILIVTVTFAAGFTVPGGVYGSDHPNPHNRGMAVLADKALFRLFTTFNMIALYTSTLGALTLMWILLGDKRFAMAGIGLAYFFLNLAIFTMSVAFTAAVRLVVSNNSSLANAVTALGVIFISFIFFLRLSGMFPLGLQGPLVGQVSGFIVWISTFILATSRKPKDSDSDSQEANKKDR